MTAQPAAEVTPDAIMASVGITSRRPSQDAGADSDGGWDGDPVPLTAPRLRPAFPVDALPGWVAEHVAAVAAATQTPVDLPASVALACLSTAAGGKALAQPDRSWTEPVNLYTVVALPPGSRKTSVFRAMTAPITAAERALHEQLRPQRIEAELSARVANARAENLARQAEHATTNPAEVMAEATAAAEEAARITVPDLPRLTTDDVTPESCISLLARHAGRIAVLSAEGDAFATLVGARYSANPNLSVFLKGHGGDTLQVDRKGRDPEYIDRPAVTVGITTQPATLTELAAVPGAHDRGVTGRILYSLPENTVGRRRIDTDPVPEHVEHTYASQLTALVLSLAAHDEPVTLTLTDDAARVLHDLRAWIEPQLLPGTGPLAGIAAWAGKWAGHVLRIAALLHLAANLRTGYTQPITADTMRNAEQIGRYYLAHAHAAHDLMGGSHDPALDDARRVLTWITQTGAATFSRRDLFVALRSQRFARVTDLDPALALLTEHAHVRPAHTRNPNGGRPSIRYEVHPAARTEPRRDPSTEVL